jgi:hypothetical protein
MERLARELSAAAANRHRALARLHSARSGEEQREADRDFIICDRALNEARRAYENAKEFAQ